MESEITLPIEVLLVLKTLRAASFEAYIVGGAVRDVLMGTTAPSGRVIDFDFTTNAKPEEVQLLFKESYYENEFGTVSISPDDLRAQYELPAFAPIQVVESTQRVIDVARASKIHSSLSSGVDVSVRRQTDSVNTRPPFQITTYRSEDSYDDHRRPTSVNWGSSLTDDLSRRDFTINAIALSISDEILNNLKIDIVAESQTIAPNQYQVHDPYGGQADLASKLVKTVGEPAARFQEDALRLLRAVRLTVQLEFSLEEATKNAVKQNANLLSHVSGERVRDELLKMLASTQPKAGIELLDETGLLPIVLPELVLTKGVQQGGHHTTDVWTHSLDALQACPSTDPIVRLATLLHDISKPQTYNMVNGSPTFYNHELVGSRTAKAIGQRLKLSREDCDRLFILVRFHMFHYQPELTDAAIRRMMRNILLENIDDILDLREADRLGSGARKTSWRLEELKSRMIEQLHQPFDVTDLAINGNDLMSELQLTPGPVVGQLLHKLLEHVLETPADNTREKLLDLARTLIEEERAG